MSYDITTEIEKGYLKVIVSGEQTLEDNLKLVSFIVEECVSNKVDKVAVDIRGLWGQPGLISNLTLVNFVVSEALDRVKKVAIIYKPITYIYTTLFETASRTRGLNMFAFVDEDEAIEWILQGSIAER